MNFYTNVQKFGSSILLRGIEDGTRVQRKVKFKPTLYVPDNKGKSDWTALDGRPVSPMKFDSMREANDFMSTYKDVPNFPIYGNTKYVSQFILDNYPNDIKFDVSKVNILAIDIEVASDDGFPFPEEASKEVISIAVKSNQDDHYHVWALGDYDVDLSDYKGKVYFSRMEDERKLFASFVKWLNEFNNMPDVITGWNSTLFDVPYLINRAINLFGEDSIKKFSPWGIVNYRSVKMNGREQDAYDIVGISQLDYLDLFRKFAYSYGPQESYKLDHIAEVVVGEKKLDYSEHGNLFALYKNDHQKFIDYNIRDVELIWKLDDKLGLIELALTMAYRGGVNYTDTLGTTAIWDTIIYRELAKNKVTIPPMRMKEKPPYDGGYVKAPVPNMYDWVCSFDLNSLYPNIIIQYNMSPETITGMVTPNVNPDTVMEGKTNSIPNTSMACNGVHFSNEKQGIIPKIVDEMYQERVIMKVKMLDSKRELETVNKSNKAEVRRVERDIAQYENRQMAAKILLNSLYGAMASKYFRYFDIRIAEAITLSGQTAIRFAERQVNNFLNNACKTKQYKDYVIAIDTDSLYVHMEDVVNVIKGENKIDALDEFCSKVMEPVIAKGYDILAKQGTAFDNRMKMKREAIADRGIWTAKKRYILNVYDNEGVRFAEPKIKMTGIEAIKSSTPAFCREAMKGLFKTIMTTDEQTTQREIARIETEFNALTPEEIAFPRSVNNLSKYADRKDIFKKGTTLHTRAALIYNHYIKMKGIDKRYETINSGDKVKYVHVKVPNPYKIDCIAFPSELPKELQLHQHVDYATQFDKAFISPMKLILDAIGWSVEEQTSLEDFFA